MAVKSPRVWLYWLIWDNLLLSDDDLYKRSAKRNRVAEYSQLVVPKDMHHSVLHLMHDCVLLDHIEGKEGQGEGGTRFCWFEMKRDVKWYVKQSDVCASNKPVPMQPKAQVGHLSRGALWDVLALDCLGLFLYLLRESVMCSY